MAKPRVFVSSTYYDLKHIRASLDLFVDSLGFEPVLSEKGDIAYTPDRALDESCFREAESADIFVIIVGGRYGSEAGGTNRKLPPTFFDRYESITKKEYESAASRDIPIYVLIETVTRSEGAGKPSKRRLTKPWSRRPNRPRLMAGVRFQSKGGT